MLGAQLCFRTFTTFWVSSDKPNASSYPIPSLRSSSIRLHNKSDRRSSHKQILISCSFGSQSRNDDNDDQDHQFLEASLLVSETVSHYKMLRQGFKEEIKLQSSSSSRRQLPISRAKMTSIGHSFLISRFPTPTIFLKISCDGDFLLPIIVGEFAVEKLIASFWEDDNGDCPDQFHLVKNVVEKLGYEVKMVRITERVVNTYFAKLYFSKPGENDVISVDARPSDAINVANRCKVGPVFPICDLCLSFQCQMARFFKAPIYVSRQIVLDDAIRIGYGMGRVRDTKSTYDVLLDSAAEGPDLLTEELVLVRNINLAVEEERYNDAATLRDKLMKLRNSSHGQ